MSSGKYLSLDEARRKKQLDRFAKEHPSEGNECNFDKLLHAMSNGGANGDDSANQRRQSRRSRNR